MAKRKRAALETNDDGSPTVFPVSKGRKVEPTRSDRTVTLYANNAHIDATNWDVRLRFGLIETSTPEVLKVNEVAHVYMSHEHAAAFAAALNKTLAQIEDAKKRVADLRAAKTH